MNNEELEWYRYAQTDLNTAIFLLDMHPTPLEIICYHCQQSAEKYLKGYLLSKQKELQKTHDLTVLYKECLSLNPEFQTIQDECINLSDFAVNTRYPFHLDLSETDSRKAITDAQRIQDFIIDLANYKSMIHS